MDCKYTDLTDDVDTIQIHTHEICNLCSVLGIFIGPSSRYLFNDTVNTSEYNIASNNRIEPT
jgi:hypothetical protein